MKYVIGVILGIIGSIFLFDLVEIQNINSVFASLCFLLGSLYIKE